MGVKLTPKLLKIIDDDVYANPDQPVSVTVAKYGVTAKEVCAAKLRHENKRLMKQQKKFTSYEFEDEDKE